MFKICIAIILQIVQFSTDQDTLRAMKELASHKDQAVISEKFETQYCSEDGRRHSSSFTVLFRPVEHDLKMKAIQRELPMIKKL